MYKRLVSLKSCLYFLCLVAFGERAAKLSRKVNKNPFTSGNPRIMETSSPECTDFQLSPRHGGRTASARLNDKRVAPLSTDSKMCRRYQTRYTIRKEISTRDKEKETSGSRLPLARQSTFRYIKPVKSNCVDNYQSPRAFDFTKTLRRAHDNNESSVAGLVIFEPLSVFELVRATQLPPRSKLNKLSVEFDNVVGDELKLLPLRPPRGFSPMLSYLATRIGESMAKRFLSVWTSSSVGLAGKKIDTSIGLTELGRLFSPFVYRFLLHKPSPQEWLNIQEIFLRFFSSWKLQLLYLTSNSTDEFQGRRPEVMEKISKCMMWISDVLYNMYSPAFLSQLRREQNELKSSGRGKKLPLARKINKKFLGRLIQFMIQDENSRVSINKLAMTRSYSELLKHWQVDCHSGYPLQKSKIRQQESKLQHPLRKKTRDDKGHQTLWESWGFASSEIINQAKKVEDSLAKPFCSSSLENMKMFNYGDAQHSFVINVKTFDILKSAGRLATLKLKEDKRELLRTIFHIVPDVIISSDSNSLNLEKLECLIEYKYQFKTSEYLPNLVHNYLHADENTISEWEFWPDINTKIRKRKWKFESTQNVKKARKLS